MTIKQELEALALELQKIKPGTKKYDKLMAKLDKVLNIKPSNPETVDEEWERERNDS